MTTVSGTVLVVDDDPEIAEGYASYIREEHAARIAYDGREALESLDEDVDVVLLDRRMPGLSGDEVLERIRERGLDCRVAMVTGVDPDFDIVDMPFDDYVVKPVTRRELRETVDRLSRRAAYDSQLRELYSLVSKRAVLEEEKSPHELDASRKFDRLDARIRELKGEIDRTLEALDDEHAFEIALQGDR